MSFTDRFSRALDSMFLALFMVWSVGIAVALVNPEQPRDPKGVVEIYSLVAVDSATTGV